MRVTKSIVSRTAVLTEVEDAFSGRRASGEERVRAGLESQHGVAELRATHHVDVEVGRIVDLREELEHLARFVQPHEDAHGRRGVKDVGHMHDDRYDDERQKGDNVGKRHDEQHARRLVTYK